MTLEITQTAVGIPVIIGRTVVIVDRVAFEPLLEPHCTHDVVVRHRVEGVEGVLDSLLG